MLTNTSTDFLTGMLDLLRGDSPRVPKSPSRSKRSESADRAKSPDRTPETERVIKLSHYPNAEVRKDVELPIEREDWPAPPATAVITKNIGKFSVMVVYVVERWYIW